MLKKLVLSIILLLLTGCQSGKTNKYIIYNLDKELIHLMENERIMESSYFIYPFSLPLTREQIDILETKSINIYPFYLINNSIEYDVSERDVSYQNLQLMINQNVINEYYFSSITLFPYYNEKDINKVLKKYVGKMDPEKEYIYLSENMANTMVAKESEKDKNGGFETILDHIDNKFTEEYSIKVTLTVPVNSTQDSGYINYNYEDYGPFEGVVYEQVKIEKEYYIKGILSSAVGYQSPTTTLAYIDNSFLEEIYSLSSEVDPSARIIETTDKEIEKTFKELGLQYCKLTQ